MDKHMLYTLADNFVNNRDRYTIFRELNWSTILNDDNIKSTILKSFNQEQINYYASLKNKEKELISKFRQIKYAERNKNNQSALDIEMHLLNKELKELQYSRLIYKTLFDFFNNLIKNSYDIITQDKRYSSNEIIKLIIKDICTNNKEKACLCNRQKTNINKILLYQLLLHKLIFKNNNYNYSTYEYTYVVNHFFNILTNIINKYVENVICKLKVPIIIHTYNYSATHSFNIEVKDIISMLHKNTEFYQGSKQFWDETCVMFDDNIACDNKEEFIDNFEKNKTKYDNIAYTCMNDEQNMYFALLLLKAGAIA